MKKVVGILGVLGIAAIIIISGSAVATWVYVTVYDYDDCVNIDYIERAPDGYHATLGINVAPPPPYGLLGSVILGLGSSNKMPPSTDFTVFADVYWGGNAERETYEVLVGDNVNPFVSVGSADDQGDHDFTTPSTPGKEYQYIKIEATSGEPPVPSDPIYGPEIDAVGWDKPP